MGDARDGAGDGFYAFFALLVVEVFGAPFYNSINRG